MSLKLITPAATYPITLAEAQAQCRVDGDTDYLNALIAAATAHVEDYTGRALITQTWELYLDEFSASIKLPKGPVSSVSSVKYYDADNFLQTIDAANYSTDLVSDPQWIVPVSGYTWPTVADGINVVVIRFVAGYSTVPAAIIHAIKLLVSDWYDQRNDTVSERGVVPTTVPNGVAALLANHRSYAF